MTTFVTVGVFLLQMFILGLIFADLTAEAPVHKEVVFFPLEVPVDIPTTVAVAQFVSLLVATIKEEDIFVSLKALIVVGHDERVSVRFPGATPLKWWIANTLRFLTGLLNVAVSFFFIVGSSTVLEIFESFAAVEFVSYIDNMIFRLAKWYAAMGVFVFVLTWFGVAVPNHCLLSSSTRHSTNRGYLGKMLQRMTIKVESVQLENRREKGRYWALLVFVFFCLTLIPLLACWTKVRLAQSQGFYLKQAVSPRLVVRFGDDELKLKRSTQFALNGTTARDLSSYDRTATLEYAFFSGSYEIVQRDGKLERHGGRPIYVERDANYRNDSAYSIFYYCEEQSTWVYTILGLGNATQGRDVCELGWLAVSEQTEEYSLEKVPQNWKVWTGIVSDSIVKIESDSCELPSDCSLNGVCGEDKVCKCNEGWQGRHCNVEAPYCPALAFVKYGKTSYEYSFDGPFELLTNEDDGSPIEIYERPVYYRKTPVDASVCKKEERYELYLYAGRRFFMTFWCEEDLSRYVVDVGGGKTEFRLQQNLHAYWDNVLGLELKWFSEVTDSHTGTGLQMFQVRDSYSTGSQSAFGIFFESQGTFECLNVPCEDDRTVCGRKGKCAKYDFQSRIAPNTTLEAFHKCTCSDFYGGLYCQFNPNGTYAKEHFSEFQANVTSDQLEKPSIYEYQRRYWEPLVVASGGVVTVISEEDEESNNDIGVVELNETAVFPGGSNIFSNRSNSGEGEL
ncbi:expressed unknown protein [Seminavis robusta]|uniref:EGF-like domain-containing protein n=1 Tax=Seminavis robusta TaxID=568900 RepID=A0A9N8EC40_9STRA|nr:expressed unknown protein [Seminavis robusta]|eukprot:Sro931_g221410.1 n/a (732) ;mRNA; r:2128-4766